MYNIQQIIDRYQNHLNEWNRTVTGYLQFGGHDYYEINSDKPIKINSDGYSGEFITNENGQVECYEILDNNEKPERKYYKDKEFTIPVTVEELDEHPEWDSYIDYFYDYESEMLDGIKKWFGLTPENYYLHPWFPDKQIKSFELIRIIPGGFVGDIYKVTNTTHNIGFIEIGETDYWIDYCLRYPEFFRPIYL